GEEVGRRSWREGEEAAGRQHLRTRAIGLFTHAEPRRSREHGHDLRLRMRMRRDVIVLRYFQAESKHAVLAGIAVEHRGLRARRNRRRRRPPFDILWRNHLVVAGMLTDRIAGQQSEPGHGHRDEAATSNHPFLLGYVLASTPTPAATGRPAARHSGKPSSRRRTRKPRLRSAATAS